MKKPLWQPSEKKKEDSLLKDFSTFIDFKLDKKFKTIWEWSIKNPEKFWSKFWFLSCEIKGDRAFVAIATRKIGRLAAHTIIIFNKGRAPPARIITAIRVFNFHHICP